MTDKEKLKSENKSLRAQLDSASRASANLQSKLDFQIETNQHLLSSREDLRMHLAKVQAKLRCAHASLRGAVEYLLSCGYDKAEACEPERQMLEGFQRVLSGNTPDTEMRAEYDLTKLKRRVTDTTTLEKLRSEVIWRARCHVNDNRLEKCGLARAVQALNAYVEEQCGHAEKAHAVGVFTGDLGPCFQHLEVGAKDDCISCKHMKGDGSQAEKIESGGCYEHFIVKRKDCTGCQAKELGDAENEARGTHVKTV